MEACTVHEQYQGALRLARRRNIHTVDAMIEMDMLLTAQRRAEIIAQTLANLARMLDRESAHGILAWHRKGAGGVPASAQEMFDAVRAWIDEYVEMGGVG